VSTQFANQITEENEAFIADSEGEGPDVVLIMYDQGYEDGYNRRHCAEPGNPPYTDGWWDGRSESEARSEFHGPV